MDFPVIRPLKPAMLQSRSLADRIGVPMVPHASSNTLCALEDPVLFTMEKKFCRAENVLHEFLLAANIFNPGLFHCLSASDREQIPPKLNTDVPVTSWFPTSSTLSHPAAVNQDKLPKLSQNPPILRP